VEQHRQIVVANQAMLTLLRQQTDSIIGRRPGEVMCCLGASESPNGCGTAQRCRFCGVLRAVSHCLNQGGTATEECRVRVLRDGYEESLDLLVTATPLTCGDTYALVVLRDVSAEKRKAALERVFFHDLLNAVGGLRGLLQLQSEEQPGNETAPLGFPLVQLADYILEEIATGRDLAAAEAGELTVAQEEVDIESLFSDLCQLYGQHPGNGGVKIVAINEGKVDFIRTDRTLLRRVLGNLLKNAVEASSEDDTVTIRFRDELPPTFEVHNPGVMTQEVQMQVFQRNYSTKGGYGRGLGAYGAKMLTERYLHGKISFISHPTTGTIFKVSLPNFSPA
jgi:signal transduction histidine kinase